MAVSYTHLDVYKRQELNRDDVKVAYQWQVLDTAPGQEEQPEAIYDYGEGESTDYFFPLEDMTEEELLAQNPGATWPGIEMYYALRDSQVSTCLLYTSRCV